MVVVLVVLAMGPVVTRVAAATAANNTERHTLLMYHCGMCTPFSIRSAPQFRIPGHNIYKECTHFRPNSHSNCFINPPRLPSSTSRLLMQNVSQIY